MNRGQTLQRFVLVLLGLGWVTTAAALAVAASPASLVDLPWAQIAIGCLLALWGGMARTAARIRSTSNAEDGALRLWRELVKDVVAASLIGFITFAVSAWQSWDVWLLAIMLPLGGYGGARLLEPMADAALDRITTLIRGRVGP